MFKCDHHNVWLWSSLCVSVIITICVNVITVSEWDHYVWVCDHCVCECDHYVWVWSQYVWVCHHNVWELSSLCVSECDHNMCVCDHCEWIWWSLWVSVITMCECDHYVWVWSLWVPAGDCWQCERSGSLHRCSTARVTTGTSCRGTGWQCPNPWCGSIVSIQSAENRLFQ